MSEAGNTRGPRAGLPIAVVGGTAWCSPDGWRAVRRPRRPVARDARLRGPAAQYAVGDAGLHHHQPRAPGPTVLVTGGIHGDEPAGADAAEIIRSAGKSLRGKLVVVPRCNVPALELGQRRMPGVDSEHDDLNRCFPICRADEPVKGPPTEPIGEPASALWGLVREVGPDWVLDSARGVRFQPGEPQECR